MAPQHIGPQSMVRAWRTWSRKSALGSTGKEHRHRLAWSGVEGILVALGAQGREVLIMGDVRHRTTWGTTSIEVRTSFCARLYGGRGARTRALHAVPAAHGDQ